MAAKRKRRSPLKVQRERTARAELKLKQVIAEQRTGELARAYEAATPSSYHPRRGQNRSGDSVINSEQGTLRAWARYLDENHDLAIGVLDDLVNKVVGRGIGIEPCALTPQGKPAERTNEALRKFWLRFTDSMVETTRELPWHDIERLVCRTWLRDGEMLVSHVMGNAAIRHNGPVPYSLELLEADFLPFHLFKAQQSVGDNRVIHGVEKNQWREPVAYHLLKEHPGDVGVNTLTFRSNIDTKRVDAQNITHLKNIHRIGQTRGITIFHGVLTRLEDLKQYDESERIAARVAAAFTAVITRTPEYQGEVSVDAASRRVMEMAPGMIFDDMLPGEDVKTIGSDRPNSQYDAFIGSGIKRVAAGTGTSASSIARDYKGTFSSQRQEMVEDSVMKGALQMSFIRRFVREVYGRAVDLALITNQIPTAGVDLNTIRDATYTVPPIPWIDPLKEANAAKTLIEIGVKSRHQTIRERGGDPRLVDDEIERDEFQAPQAALPAPPATNDEPDDDEETDEDTPEAASA